MKTFIVKARSKEGKTITMKIEAKDRQHAINECKKSGVLVIGVDEESGKKEVNKKSKSVKGKYICTQCGNIGSPKTETKGSIIIEIILWICLLIPGLIYTTWRHTSRYKVCKLCSSSSVIPTKSPKGMQLIEDSKSN